MVKFLLRTIEEFKKDLIESIQDLVEHSPKKVINLCGDEMVWSTLHEKITFEKIFKKSIYYYVSYTHLDTVTGEKIKRNATLEEFDLEELREILISVNN